uniref:Uncharacterized protein n=1 Tax=Solanum tuberosum TaxID=4113 RepID=M1CSV8_SOLTU
MQDLILNAVTPVRLEKGSTAKGNDNDQISTLLPAKGTSRQGIPREHEARILKDVQWVMSEKEKIAKGEGNNSKVKNQLIEPAESNGHDFLEDNQYFGPLPSELKPMDVDRILRAHDQQVQESVERTNQQKKLVKARF